MDEQRFDQLTRSLARGTSRRGVLKGVLATIGGALGLGTASSAGARTRNSNGTACATPRDCASSLRINGVFCNGVCCNGVCCNGVCCNGVCCNGVCCNGVCSGELEHCGGTCRSI